MYLLYKFEKPKDKHGMVGEPLLLTGVFATYEEMCESIGYPIADESEFGYEDDGGAFHQTEYQADMYASTFWQPGQAYDCGDYRYLMERIRPSARELQKYLNEITPVAVLDEFPRPSDEDFERAREQRFYDKPVKKYLIKVAPPGWYNDGLTQPYYDFNIFRPDEALAREAAVVWLKDSHYADDWTMDIVDCDTPLTPDK